MSDAALIKSKVLNWLQQFNTFCFLDSCGFPGHQLGFIAGAGVCSMYASSAPDALSGFQEYYTQQKGWLFGHLGYELQTSHTFAASQKEDALLFPDICFFEPEFVVQLKGMQLSIAAAAPHRIFDQIQSSTPRPNRTAGSISAIRSGIDLKEYRGVIEQLQQHLHRGDCYEINYCVEFFAERAAIAPFEIYRRLMEMSPAPFAGLYRLKDQWLICASPERYLKKQGAHLMSQPIKGTLSRQARTADGLQKEREVLFRSQKDRAENVMVVDLVRNDLSRICREGTVQVDELFGIYSFAQVHQMISTVSGRINDTVTLSEILKATFPMGSMTGAPKISVMQLIDRYEKNKRGIFSGAVGYVQPNGDFDLNVVIRSLMYNSSTRYLSYKAGSGITIYSDPEKEWEECLLKAKAIGAVLKGI
ncbi:aminodeoxychorismate synthase component I [Niabella ginsenosidivorans]|uniref:Aminodeoxychorismate synthase component I n=1 Tax=Niabella ginsenosidivorans TaxID=1176587 RepID=A0A1A9IAW0_9BACT|nr:aminodeoxychorismate synthase component I [Niabella ginsenosidivorans]